MLYVAVSTLLIFLANGQVPPSTSTGSGTGTGTGTSTGIGNGVPVTPSTTQSTPRLILETTAQISNSVPPVTPITPITTSTVTSAAPAPGTTIGTSPIITPSTPITTTTTVAPFWFTPINPAKLQCDLPGKCNGNIHGNIADNWVLDCSLRGGCAGSNMVFSAGSYPTSHGQPAHINALKFTEEGAGFGSIITINNANYDPVTNPYPTPIQVEDMRCEKWGSCGGLYLKLGPGVVMNNVDCQQNEACNGCRIEQQIHGQLPQIEFCDHTDPIPNGMYQQFAAPGTNMNGNQINQQLYYPSYTYPVNNQQQYYTNTYPQYQVPQYQQQPPTYTHNNVPQPVDMMTLWTAFMQWYQQQNQAGTVLP